jgi:sortase A
VRLPDDPLLRAGVVAMAFALALVGIVAVASLLAEPMEPAAAVKSDVEPAAEPLVRSDPGVKPWVEEEVPLRNPERQSEPSPDPEPQPEPEVLQPEPETQEASRPEREAEQLPVGETDWPLPTSEQIERTNRPRQYDLAPGAIMGLTIEALGLYDVPILNSDSQWALDAGVIHEPETSLPWSQTPERNVYLAGHRLGWPGTGSHLVFYRLNELANGDEILLRDRDGRRYEYRVIDSFVVAPDDTWVMGRVRGRDLLTLQTCTPIPAFDKRLIIRAERV